MAPEDHLTLEDEIRAILYMHGTTGLRTPFPDDEGEAKIAQKQRFDVAFNKIDGLEDAVVRIAKAIDALEDRGSGGQ